MIGVVLDTNIIVSANLKPNRLEAYVVSLALNGLVRQFISADIFDEYGAVLRRLEFPFAPQEIERLLARVRKSSKIVRPAAKISGCAHEADNRFLECAAAAKADFLVTGNKRHFSDAWKATRVVNAREFLEYFAAQQSD